MGGWELSWVVIDMDPKANLYNTYLIPILMRLCGNGYGGRGGRSLRQSLQGISLIQYIIPILEGGWLEAGLGSHVTWIRRSIS